jgi:peptidylprolyl isomerase
VTLYTDPVRRIPVLLALTALAATGLVGCTSAADTSCTLPTTADGVSDLVEVAGPLDEAPEVEVRTPFRVDSTTSWVIERGDGAAITDDRQTAALDISLISGTTGEPLVATAYDSAAIQSISLDRWAESFPALPGALQCATEGSRVAVALSTDGIASEALAGLGLEEGDSAIAVVDVRKVFLPRADGADQFTESRGLPTVVRAPDGRPGIIVPEGDAPTEPVVQVLKKGDGAAVTRDASVVVHVTSVAWDDPKTGVDSTWDSEPAVLTLDTVPAVLADALDGKSVGSQLLVVDPGQTEGDEAGEARVYVIDILGVDG